MLTAAMAAFGELVHSISDDRWDADTPCGGWDVRALVAHVVVTDSQAASLLTGQQVSWVVEVDVSVLGTNPMASWRGTAVSSLEAFSRPGVLDEHFEHPLGRLSGHRLLGNRLSENVAHGWDLAQSLGAEWSVADDTAEWLLDFWQSHLDALDRDFFAPVREVSPAAPALERFLALTGRG